MFQSQDKKKKNSGQNFLSSKSKKRNSTLKFFFTFWEMELELWDIYFTCYNKLIAQDLWQFHYPMLSIIFLN